MPSISGESETTLTVFSEFSGLISPGTKKKSLKFCYFLQTNPSWQTFLYFVSWVFMFLAFIEPANSRDEEFFKQNNSLFAPLVALESLILCLFFFECGMEVYHRSFDKIRDFKSRFISNHKLLIKIIANFIFLIDFITFYSDPLSVTFRHGRIFRPGTWKTVFVTI